MLILYLKFASIITKPHPLLWAFLNSWINLDFSLLSYFFLSVLRQYLHDCIWLQIPKNTFYCMALLNCISFNWKKKLVSLLWHGLGRIKDLHSSVTSSFLSMVWLWSPSSGISVKTKSTINGSIVQHSLYLRTHSLTSDLRDSISNIEINEHLKSI